jgi:antitoxin ParD1/3/4
MTSLNISLPEALREFVDDQVKNGGYGTASEYIRELIRQDQKRAAEEKLEALLLEGLDSGEPIEVTPEYWERKRRELIERHTQKAKRA